MAEGRRPPARKPDGAARAPARTPPARTPAKAGKAPAKAKPARTPGRAAKPGRKQARAAKPARPGSRARRRRTALGLTLGAVVLVGLLFAFVYPTRTFLDQRDDMQRARAQYQLLATENAKLTAEAKRLQNPDEIERRARDYGLVKPGEQAFEIVPAPTTTPTTAAPAGGSTTPSP